MDLRLQPLRVPAGWRIDWNTLYEVDPSDEQINAGYFGGSSLLLASHVHRRFLTDVGWRPEDDPEAASASRSYTPRGSGRRRAAARKTDRLTLILIS
jgi:hypothetical protein